MPCFFVARAPFAAEVAIANGLVIVFLPFGGKNDRELCRRPF